MYIMWISLYLISSQNLFYYNSKLKYINNSRHFNTFQAYSPYCILYTYT